MEEKEINMNVGALMGNPDVPKYYMNGFMIGNGNSDGFIIIQTNAIPAAILNMSFTTMKTLAESLNSVILQLEKKTGKNIATTHEIDKIYEI